MTSKLTRFCDGIIESGWLVALISIPLFFNIHSERVFEPDKVALLRSIALLIFFAWLVRFIDQHGWQEWSRLRWRHQDSIWRIPFVLPILTLVIVYLIATLLSITPRTSWAGSYQRLQGAYTTLAYVVFYAGAVIIMRNHFQLRRVPTAVIITSIPVAFYGLIQHFGHDPLPWGGDVIDRVAGHMGNAIFIAAYLIMVVPLTLGRIIDAFTNILGDEEISYADVARSTVYIFAIAIQLLAIYWSGSRGPLLGLATALFAFVLVLLVTLRNASGEEGSLKPRDFLYAFLLVLPLFIPLMLSGLFGDLTSPSVSFYLFAVGALLSIGLILLFVVLRRGWNWLWLSWLLLTSLLAGWMLLFNLPEPILSDLAETPVIGSVFESQMEWKELPDVGSYGRMLDPSQTTGRQKSNRVRVLIWEGVVDLIAPHSPLEYPSGDIDIFNFWRPLIGYGPESMYVAYNRFYPPELATVEARNASPDRSHNETFDALVVTGLAGFIAWQAVYISAFYYGFKYLGVVRTKRDRRVLLSAWIGGALVGALLSFTLLDPIYFGVAVPTGTIVGLIIYLFYYALFAGSGNPAPERSSRLSAFQTDYLLVNALLAAVLAHYVEVHFGIAVAATRLHFFLFLALIFVIAYKLPVLRPAEKSGKKRRVRFTQEERVNIWGPIMAWTFLIALIVGTLGYDFINYVLPADKIINTGADLTAGDIFNQALFVNTQSGFADSPFIYLMIVLSWISGIVIVLSEMIRQKTVYLQIPQLADLAPTRRYAASAVFFLLGLVGVAQRFLLPSSMGPTAALARSIFFLGGIVCLWVAWDLVRDHKRGRHAGLVTATVGIILSFPVMVAGSWLTGFILVTICVVAFILLWDNEKRLVFLPPLSLALLSFAIGIIYTALQAHLLREALLYLIFYQGIEPISTLFGLLFRPDAPVSGIQEARVLEAVQAKRFISMYYLFLFAVLVLAGVSLARWRARQVRSRGWVIAYAVAIIVSILLVPTIYQTNLKPVQADMVFKRGRPFDEQALMAQDPLLWDVAIAIYEEALDLAPLQDYYYLFLGRAYLERASGVEQQNDQLALLETAEQRLLRARELNPLNTDHSANLARLHTRWAVASSDPEETERHLSLAESYYQDALRASPQNSLIRNETARLAFDLRRDCDQAIDIYDESLQVDPYYDDTYFEFADVLAICAEAHSDDAVGEELYQFAIENLDIGLSRDPQRARAWIQAGQINHRLGHFADSLQAFEQARDLNELNGLPTWNIDYMEAIVKFEMGDKAVARALAEQALQTAPADVTEQIQSLIDSLQ